MPLYEYRCLKCDDTFEQRRSMTDDGPVHCPAGHADTKRLLSVFASVGARGTGTAPAPMPMAGGGGGCCGGACGCG